MLAKYILDGFYSEGWELTFRLRLIREKLDTLFYLPQTWEHVLYSRGFIDTET